MITCITILNKELARYICVYKQFLSLIPLSLITYLVSIVYAAYIGYTNPV